jgi:alpha-amylase
VSTTFDVEASTTWGQNVFVVGDTAALGGWDPARAVALSAAAYPRWRAAVTLPGGTAVRYKYLKKNGTQVVWESDPDRVRSAPGAGTCAATWADTWR